MQRISISELSQRDWSRETVVRTFLEYYEHRDGLSASDAISALKRHERLLIKDDWERIKKAAAGSERQFKDKADDERKQALKKAAEEKKRLLAEAEKEAKRYRLVAEQWDEVKKFAGKNC